MVSRQNLRQIREGYQAAERGINRTGGALRGLLGPAAGFSLSAASVASGFGDIARSSGWAANRLANLRGHFTNLTRPIQHATDAAQDWFRGLPTGVQTVAALAFEVGGLALALGGIAKLAGLKLPGFLRSGGSATATAAAAGKAAAARNIVPGIHRDPRTGRFVSPGTITAAGFGTGAGTIGAGTAAAVGGAAVGGIAAASTFYRNPSHIPGLSRDKQNLLSQFLYGQDLTFGKSSGRGTAVRDGVALAEAMKDASTQAAALAELERVRADHLRAVEAAGGRIN